MASAVALDRRALMLEGPIVPTIVGLAAPNVRNVAVQSIVLIADGWLVGKLGTTELAALTLVSRRRRRCR